MAYQPPLNGGRINASIGGNSTSAGAGYKLISTGNMILAGGNNITLSQNGSTITISGASPAAASVNFSAGTTSNSLAAVTFANSNGVSFGLNGSTITASHNGITSQSNPALSGTNGSFTYQTASFGNLNGLSFYTSNGSMVGTYTVPNVPAQTNQTVGLYGLGNTTQSSSTTLDARSLSFNGLGGVSVGYSNGSIQISGGGGGGAGLSAGTQSVSTGTVNFANSNGVSFGMSGSNQITATVATNYAASNHSHGDPTLNLTNLSGTTASASNGLTLSLSAAPMFNGGVSDTIAGGTTYGTMNTLNADGLVFYAGTNIGLSQSTGAAGNSITILGAGGGGGGGVALANSDITLTSGTANLSVAGGAMTISGTSQSFNFSVPAQSSLSATGAVSISSNGSTISIGAPAIPTLSRWEYPEGMFTALSAHGQGSLSLNHMYVPFNIIGASMKIGGSLSAATNTSATIASVNISLWMGIYTLNGSTLSLASSGSANNGFQWSQSASTTANTSVNSMRQLTVPMNVNMTPGQYWVGAVISSATTYQSVGYTMFGGNQVASTATGAVLTPIGLNTSANRDVMLFQGIYTANTSAGPANIVGSEINNYSSAYVQRANFYNVIYNAVY